MMKNINSSKILQQIKILSQKIIAKLATNFSIKIFFVVEFYDENIFRRRFLQQKYFSSQIFITKIYFIVNIYYEKYFRRKYL